jgi:formylglycine-generating enzyme required for sulfatase activity
MPAKKLSAVSSPCTAKVAAPALAAAGAVFCDELNFKLIPASSFLMGSRDESDNPVHSVNVSTFFVGETEVNYWEWKSVLAWAKLSGYEFTDDGNGGSDKHPVTNVSWYDAVKWCNAKSEIEGFVPCYKVGGDIYRKGEGDKVTCDWKSNGYRLPTEAEWEKAARGGLVGKQFPNGDTLTEKEANFNGSGTVEVGKYPANGYGLYDMAGNVCEWCWDWYDDERLGVDDPRGPETGFDRVHRGGSWYSDAAFCSSASRYFLSPDYRYDFIGFRLARGSIRVKS